jgi:hypothetical protein
MGIFSRAMDCSPRQRIGARAIRSRGNERVVIAMRVASAEGLLFPDKKGRTAVMPRLPENLRHIMMTPMCILMLLIVPSLHAGGKFYQQRNLVSDGSVTAEHTDANLVNPWGIAFNPNGFV